jgi:pSer/pThr/pTyr-binding forkhead associated (FHA) protein
VVKLIRLEGRAADDEFDVDEPQAIIGRAPDCDVVVFDPQASRRHARLRKVGSDYVVEDLQEANPTIVNDQVLRGARRLRDGDLIVVGGVVLLVEQMAATERAQIRPTADDGPATVDVMIGPAGPPSRPSVARPIVAQRASQTGQAMARRLDAAARRLQARASALATRHHPERASDIATIDTILGGHEQLGGDDELARIAGLLHDRLGNQTDIRALYRLGAETQALLNWSQLAMLSIAEVSNLADWLELR